MTIEIWGMIGLASATLVAGLILKLPGFLAVSGGARILALGPVFEATTIDLPNLPMHTHRGLVLLPEGAS
jgi:hypothetical protein